MHKITNIAVSPVSHKDKFLLIKRIKPPYKGMWSMVGGKSKNKYILEFFGLKLFKKGIILAWNPAM